MNQLDAGWNVASLFLMVATGFAANVIAARMLDQSEAAPYFLALATATVFTHVGRWGLDQLGLRAGASARSNMFVGREAASKPAAAVLIVGPAAGLCAGLVLEGFWAVSGNHPAHHPEVAGLVAVFVGAEAVRQVCSESVRGSGNIRCAILTGAGSRGALSLVLVLVLALTTARAGATGLIAASAAASLLLGAVAIRAVSRAYKQRLSRPVEAIASSAHAGGQVMLGGLAVMLMSQSGVFVANWFLPLNDSAAVALALRIALLLEAPLFVANAILMPHIARGWATGDRETVRDLLARGARWTFVVTASMTVSVAIFGSPLLGAVFGQPYRAAFAPLVVLSAGLTFSAWCGSAGTALNMSGHEADSLKVSAVACALALASQLALAPVLGAVGIAVGATVGLASFNVMCLVVLRRRVGFDTRARFNLAAGAET